MIIKVSQVTDFLNKQPWKQKHYILNAMGIYSAYRVANMRGQEEFSRSVSAKIVEFWNEIGYEY